MTRTALVAAVLGAASACTRAEAPVAPQIEPPKTAAAAPAVSPSASPSASVAAPSPSPPPRTRYAFERPHSPLTSGVVRHLREIAARQPSLKADVFAKVGDSITFSDDSLRCFARPDLTLGEHEALRPLVERFLKGDAAGSDPFRRESESAKIGWSAWQALNGSDPPLAREISRIQPRIALVQYGTNDIEIHALHHYADRLLEIVDFLQPRGVVPVLFTIPPRRDRVDAGEDVPRYNAAVRGVAMARQVPLVDYQRELSRLPGQGMAADGIHPSTYVGPRGRDACDLTAAGLRNGYDVRNLLSLQALERVGNVLPDGVAPLDAEPPALAGAGDVRAPWVVDALPFVDVRSVAPGRGGALTHYEGCSRSHDAPGMELVYELHLTRRTELELIGFDLGGARLDLYLLRGLASGERCVASGERNLRVAVEPGTYFVSVDPVPDDHGALGAGDVIVALLAG